MKIKLWDRLILFFGALLTILSGAALIVAGLQITGFMIDMLPSWARVVSICLGALCVLFGVYLLVFPRKFRYGRHDFVVQRTDNGELRISVKAIEGLVQKCIDMHDEIKVVSTRIRNTREGVMVDLNIALANNISIPLAVAALQKQIKQYLSASSGIDVTEVRVSVDTAQMPVGKAAPLPKEEEQPQAEEAPQEAPQEEHKQKPIPLHQRIFGRPEAPAIVPEPPKPAEDEAKEEIKEETTAEAVRDAAEAAAEEIRDAAEDVQDAAEDITEEIAEETDDEEALEDTIHE